MHPRTAATLEELDKANWFCCVGMRDTTAAIVLSSWKEAIAHCGSVEWENLWRTHMGWNDARASLLAPGWRSVSEEAPTARTFDGTPVKILHVERQEDSIARGPDPVKVRAWFVDRGFKLHQPSPKFVFRRFQRIFSADQRGIPRRVTGRIQREDRPKSAGPVSQIGRLSDSVSCAIQVFRRERCGCSLRVCSS